MWCEKSLRVCVTLMCLILALPAQAFGEDSSDEVLVPKDTTFALELLSPMSTKTNKKGDKFECKVLSPVEYAGAIVSGHLRDVKNSGKANGKSELDMAFDTVALSDGRTGDFNAQVKEVNDVANASNEGVADPEGTVKGKSRIRISVKSAVKGAIIGAGIGAIVAGTKGAAIGAAIGAGAVVTSTLVMDGPELEFKSGTQFTVVTNSPSHRKTER